MFFMGFIKQNSFVSRPNKAIRIIFSLLVFQYFDFYPVVEF
jgi:hypothetical protein